RRQAEARDAGKLGARPGGDTTNEHRRGPGLGPDAEQLLRDRVVQLSRQPGALLEDRELAAALVQPGVGQRDGRVRREQPEQLLVPFCEAAGDTLAGGEDDTEYVT